MGDPVSEPPPEPSDLEPPDLEQILKMSQGIAGPMDQVIESMSAIHAQWYKSWVENGIPEPQAAVLLRVMVAVNCGGSLHFGS